MKTTFCGFVLLFSGLKSLPAEAVTARQLFYDEEPAAKAPAKTQPPANKKIAPSRSRRKAAPSDPQPEIIDVAYKPSPLALRYTLLKIGEDTAIETSSDAAFRSGDKLQLKVEGNRDGHLYVVHRGSSGNWKALFPSPEIPNSVSRIVARRAYQIPSEYVFRFNDEPGQEELFLVYSLEPVKDFDSLLDSVQQRKGDRAPTSPPASPATTLLAASRGNISDEVISKLRELNSRDLIIEKVETKQPASTDRQEPAQAVYVANNSGGQVVADIRLIHR
jgi:hypothetical protein